MNNVSILLDPTDNVATALKDLKEGETVTVMFGRAQSPPTGAAPDIAAAAEAGASGQGQEVTYTVVLREDIAFGHKFALRDISAGTDVLKYGLPIGKALVDIRAGDWVHVHNCRSDHFGSRHEKYGIRA